MKLVNHPTARVLCAELAVDTVKQPQAEGEAPTRLTIVFPPGTIIHVAQVTKTIPYRATVMLPFRPKGSEEITPVQIMLDILDLKQMTAHVLIPAEGLAQASVLRAPDSPVAEPKEE